MTKFIIQGDVKQACAGLKATLDAQDASFKAQLNAAVKLAPPPQKRAPAPAPMQVAPVAKPAPWAGTSLGTNRNRRFS